MLTSFLVGHVNHLRIMSYAWDKLTVWTEFEHTGRASLGQLQLKDHEDLNLTRKRSCSTAMVNVRSFTLTLVHEPLGIDASLKEEAVIGAKVQNTPQKAKMLSKATALFWKKGYNATSMRDIAKAYGCKPANIYNFFSNKEQILFEVLQEEMEQILAPVKHLEEEDPSDPVDQLRLFIESFAKLALRYRRSSKLLFDVGLENLSVGKRKEIIAMRDRFDGILRTVIRRGKEADRFGEVDEKLASHMIASMVVRSRMWFQPGKGLTESEVAEFIFNFTLNGLTGSTTER